VGLGDTYSLDNPEQSREKGEVHTTVVMPIELAGGGG
jgi:hypothetical protein